MIIQCKKEMLDTICDFMKGEPIIVEEAGGYIDCFDKGWIFVQLPTNDKLVNTFMEVKSEYIIGLPEKNMLIQCKVGENEQYIFLRKNEMLWGVSSYLTWRTNK